MLAPNVKSEESRRLTKLIGERIKQIRQSKHLSQEQFGRLLDMPQSTISSYETGYSEPNVGIIFEIAGKLHVPVSALFPLDESKNEADEDRRVLDIIHSDPRWMEIFNNQCHITDAGWSAILSVLHAVTQREE